MTNIQLINGDCLEEMKKLPDNSVDAVVSDPPYGLSFMGKRWDYDVPSQEIWAECLRVLKPGGYLLAFAGTRTQHRMAVRIEDAGFEIRDMIAWVYGSGFPKSLNVGKVIDKFLKTGNASWNGTGDSSNGALGYSKLQHKQDYRPEDYSNRHQNKSEITEEKAKEWEGWGTALKPALEPITVARKPLSEKTVAENCLKWGTGGINIDGCRVEATKEDMGDWDRFKGHQNSNTIRKNMVDNKTEDFENRVDNGVNNLGRFPANLIHDGSDEVVSLFPNTKSGARSSKHQIGNDEGEMFNHGIYGKYKAKNYEDAPADSGSASRFFYCAKASKSERNKGCDELEEKERIDYGGFHSEKGLIENNRNPENRLPMKNNHPTVKPIALMEYLVKLVSREGATVLDPFMGSGTTGIACRNLNRNFIGIELDKDYFEIATKRIYD